MQEHVRVEHARPTTIMNDEAPPDHRALATVILVTKNEYDLVDDFLLYYSAIFGAGNVVVVDNGSTDARLAPIYRRHRDAGVRFILERREFCHAADFMTEHMRPLVDGCRFLLPLETDEFMFLDTAKNNSPPDVSAIREAVFEHLRGLPDNVSVLRYGSFLGSCVVPSDAGYASGAYTRPAAQIKRFRDQGWDKLIIRAAAFDRMTVWCHHAQCTSGIIAKSTLLGLLHFHDTGRRRRLERAMPVVSAYRHIDLARDTDAEKLAKGRIAFRGKLVCGHKLEYLLDHLSRLECLRAFRRHLGRLPISVEEMSRYTGDPSSDVLPDEAVRRDVAKGVLSRQDTSGRLGWDELLYSEEHQDHEMVVTQVADVLTLLHSSDPA